MDQFEKFDEAYNHRLLFLYDVSPDHRASTPLPVNCNLRCCSKDEVFTQRRVRTSSLTHTQIHLCIPNIIYRNTGKLANTEQIRHSGESAKEKSG